MCEHPLFDVEPIAQRETGMEQHQAFIGDPAAEQFEGIERIGDRVADPADTAPGIQRAQDAADQLLLFCHEMHRHRARH